MKLLGTAFTFEKGEFPKLDITPFGGFVSARFTGKGSIYPNVSFFLHSSQDIVNFKNSVIQECEKALEKMKGTGF